MDAAHWRAMQSLVAVARVRLVPAGHSATLQKTLLWATDADGMAEAVSEAPGQEAVLGAGASAGHDAACPDRRHPCSEGL